MTPMETAMHHAPALAGLLDEAAEWLAEDIPAGTPEIEHLEGDVRLDELDLYCVNVMRRASAALRASDARVRELEAATADDATEQFLSDVRRELARARSLFPGDDIMGLAMAEEAGELVKAMLDEPFANVRKEAVQTAVMAARIVLDGDNSVAKWRASKGLDPLPSAPVSAARDHDGGE